MSVELTITVTEDEARRIRQRIDSGAHASAEDVVRAGLDALALAEISEPDDAALRAAIDEADRDTRPDLSAEEFFDRMYRHIDSVAAAQCQGVSCA